jgi:hypothetical protein
MDHPELFVLQKTIPDRILFRQRYNNNEEALEENAGSRKELFVPLFSWKQTNASCFLPAAFCLLSCAFCLLLSVSCFLSPAFCLLLSASCFLPSDIREGLRSAKCTKKSP